MSPDSIRLLLGVLAGGATVIASITTGKTLNPLRGMRPFIVARAEQPTLYWSGVVFGGLFWAFIVCLGSGAFVN